MARILSVSYDEPLLRTRHMLLEKEGYEVTSSLGFTHSLEHCRRGNFDLFLLGHSIPQTDKQQLVTTFRQHCTGHIISLRRSPGEQSVDDADFCIEPDPDELLKLVARIFAGGTKSSDETSF